MSPSSRRVALALAVTTALSIIGASLLIGGLGGNWLAFLALAAVLCVACFIAFVLLAFGPSAMAVSEDDLWESDDPEVRITHPHGATDLFGDRDRWAS